MTGAPEAAPAAASDGARPAETAHRRRLLAGALRVPAPTRRALLHLPFPALLALSAVLNIHRLSQNGYANIFYSAGVKSTLRSLHNFLFVSFDPGGLITIDKPPLALWVQALSAKLFGFSPMSLLLPEAIAGVLSVALIYLILNRRLGPLAALAGGLALAVFPSFVAVSRDNGVDPVLLLLMILACAAALRAIDNGRLVPLLLCAVLLGLAFNTKTLAAYLLVPPIAVAYLLCGSGRVSRRILPLLGAGVLMLIVSAAWIAVVELTPASQRPYVGSSTNNTELGLTFEYNGVGRVGGQVGGPGRVPTGTGGLVQVRTPAEPGHRRSASTHPRRASRAHTSRSHTSPGSSGAGSREVIGPGLFSPILRNGREENPIPFGGGTGALRLFGSHLGDQDAWFLPFSLFSLLALLVAGVPLGRRLRLGLRRRRHEEPAGESGNWRRDPRLALGIVFGGWLLVEAVVLSFSKGIVHPYYVSALAPGAAAMAGLGAVLLTELARRRPRDPRVLLLLGAVAGTVAVQVTILHREHYMLWLVPILIAGASVGTIAVIAVRRIAPYAMAMTFCLLLVGPAGYSTTTWLAPVEGTFPAAGPKQAIGTGGVGIDGSDLHVERDLLRYVAGHRPGTRWAVLTDASETAAPLILMGLDAGALAGYSGTDPALDGPQLARLVRRREARYVALGGDYSSRGGNLATVAVRNDCHELPWRSWGGEPPHYESLVLFDCAGRERELEG
jgi:4-amino-4-deoxy-L-arabinose transferase-like glycosyltransferase